MSMLSFLDQGFHNVDSISELDENSARTGAAKACQFPGPLNLLANSIGRLVKSTKKVGEVNNLANKSSHFS